MSSGDADLVAVEREEEQIEKKKKLILKSSDDQEFEVDEQLVARASITLKNMIDDGLGHDGVPLYNVTGVVLAKIVEFWNHHADAILDDNNEKIVSVKGWNSEFLDHMDKDELFYIINAASYLETKPLMELTFQHVANRIKDLTVEEVRDYFGIENDFTLEEEQNLRKENEWAFQ